VAPDWSATRSFLYSDHIIRNTTDGSIVLLHDNLIGVGREHANAAVEAVATALKAIVPALKEKNTAFKTVSEQFKT
jgi:hypothetical protein